MKTSLCCVLMLVVVAPLMADPTALSKPIVDESLVFQERGGLVAVEAEHFSKQELTKVRTWYRTTATDAPKISPDGDGRHVLGASGGCYVEALPDTRRTHGEKLIKGQNFSNEPGKMAILSYRVHFQTTGRYYVWVRTFSTGTEDNGLHVGIDGKWPASGQRLQWTAKRKWFWDSKQRTAKNHGGEPGKIFLDIDEPGVHTITFSMREDGFEFDKWLMTKDRRFRRPEGVGPASVVKVGMAPKAFAIPKGYTEVAVRQPMNPGPRKAALVQPRKPDGPGKVVISGESKQWHKVTLTLDGPFAHEQDNEPNPFTDRRFEVEFTHSSGKPSYRVPGYFAAVGKAGNTSAESGTKWRAHFSPDKAGKWTYRVHFVTGKHAALDAGAESKPVGGFHGKTGTFEVGPTDKKGVDFRGKGRLEYVGKHYLRFAGSGEYFLKAGPDAPETLLAYVDFDGTTTRKTKLKTWKPHVRDWKPGDPTWKDGKGKGLIGALNYLSSKGCNAFSFLPYNAGGDGDNVWPFRARDDKLHYDCSKLDQWGVVFDHATTRGLYLHFKMQEQENDDNTKGRDNKSNVPASLDGGDLGPTRKLYCRELVARFGHALALNWNLGEENTQSPKQQRDMAKYIREVDPYDHHIVVHTFPNTQDKVYRELIGNKSVLTGASLQNDWSAAHRRTKQWVSESAKAGKPWVVANDEQGPAPLGVPADIGYKGFDGKAKAEKRTWTMHDIRKSTLWGTLTAGGAGVEYYFGYKLPENDLVCEDFRSRDRSWDYCRIALEFFRQSDVPFSEMTNADELVGNTKGDNSKYCFAKKGEAYVVYLPSGGSTMLDLSGAKGAFDVSWYDPRRGGALQRSKVTRVTGGGRVSIGPPPAEPKEDWAVLVRKR